MRLAGKLNCRQRPHKLLLVIDVILISGKMLKVCICTSTIVAEGDRLSQAGTGCVTYQ